MILPVFGFFVFRFANAIFRRLPAAGADPVFDRGAAGLAGCASTFLTHLLCTLKKNIELFIGSFHKPGRSIRAADGAVIVRLRKRKAIG